MKRPLAQDCELHWGCPGSYWDDPCAYCEEDSKEPSPTFQLDSIEDLDFDVPGNLFFPFY